MLTISETDDYRTWFANLADRQAKARIATRLIRMSLGNPGDVAPVGKSIHELRMHFGPGYRIYYLQKGDSITLLCGGNKSTQARDIARAHKMIDED